MPTYKVTGYDRETKKRRTIVVVAKGPTEARRIAYSKVTYPVLGTDKVREFLASGFQPKDFQ